MKLQRASAFADAVPVDGRGHRHPETLAALNRRDTLLIEARHRFCTGMSDRAAASMLRTVLLRYQTGRWRRSRADLSCPHDAERIDALCWHVLRLRDHVPERLIRLTLSRSS